QPEQGNEQLWVVREVLSGAILGAANLQQATATTLAELLRPIAAAAVPVLGVVSDAQESIRLAVAAVFPQAPHQLCQYHALAAAAGPTGAEVRQHVESYLDDLSAAGAAGDVPAWLQPQVDHLITVRRRLGEGLYHC